MTFPNIAMTRRFRTRSTILCMFVLLNVCIAKQPSFAQSDAPLNLAKQGNIAALDLIDIGGQMITTECMTDKSAIVLIFVTTDCPIANSYQPTLVRLYEEFKSSGIVFALVHEGPGQTKEKLMEHAKEFSVPFPVVMDPDHQIAARWNATKTPEAVVIDKGNNVVYQGRIDDLHQGFGKKRIQPSRKDLKIALVEFMAGEPVSVKKTASVGCSIPRVQIANIPSQR